MSACRIERVVVERHLRVEREQVAGRGDDQRIDFEQRRVGRDERLVERRHHLDGLADLVARQAELKRELPRLERLQPERRIDGRLEDAIGRLFGDLLDLDAAIRADHQHRRARVERSMTRPRYSSRVDLQPSSTSTRCTIRPSGPVWWVTSACPSICSRDLLALRRALARP